MSPAWPISYDDLEPYYTEAEHLYQVHGERGEDPTEPPASAAYRYPAVSHEPRIQQLSDDWARAGLQAVPRPARRHAGRARPAEEPVHPLRHLRRASLPGRTPSPTPRWSAWIPRWSIRTSRCSPAPTSHGWRPARRAGKSPGSWSSATARRSPTPPTSSSSPPAPSTPPRCCCAPLSDQHPRGLANGSDVVGRHYMGHINSVLMALSRCPNPTVFQKTLALNDFYFGSAGVAAIRWGTSPSSASSTASRSRPARRRSRRAGPWISWASIRSTSGSPRRICPIPRTG